MDASSCVGSYDGQYHEDMMHGRGVFTSGYGILRHLFATSPGGWTYSGALERDRPTEGELVEADGRRFKVTYAMDCAVIFDNPKAKTKVGVVCGAAAQELPAVRTRPCEAAGMCGAGYCVGTLAACVCRE